MKLVSFERRDGQQSFGVLHDDGFLFDIAAPGVTTLREAIATWSTLELNRRAQTGKPVAASEVKRWLPPIVNPEKIICIGMNYRTHAKEVNVPIPAKPALFVRFPSSQVGHLEATVAPLNSTHYDYEAELAVIIGRGGRHIAVDKALEAVAGYACFAENSLRDFQKHSPQATAGKNFEGCGAFGPWMVTSDSIKDPQALQIIGRLNGEELQRGETSDMIFSVAELVSYVSSFTRLVAGDVIVTGTPSGVGFLRTPPLFMKPGDVFEVDIAGVGLLRNPVISEVAA